MIAIRRNVKRNDKNHMLIMGYKIRHKAQAQISGKLASVSCVVWSISDIREGKGREGKGRTHTRHKAGYEQCAHNRSYKYDKQYSVLWADAHKGTV